MKKILFINAKLRNIEKLQDIYVADGKFQEIAHNLSVKVQADKIVDLGGKLVISPYCDPHIHLDYVFTALKPVAANKTGSLFEGIQRWSEHLQGRFDAYPKRRGLTRVKELYETSALPKTL